VQYGRPAVQLPPQETMDVHPINFCLAFCHFALARQGRVGALCVRIDPLEAKPPFAHFLPGLRACRVSGAFSKASAQRLARKRRRLAGKNKRFHRSHLTSSRARRVVDARGPFARLG
jgi:hypothetical protein